MITLETLLRVAYQPVAEPEEDVTPPCFWCMTKRMRSSSSSRVILVELFCYFGIVFCYYWYCILVLFCFTMMEASLCLMDDGHLFLCFFTFACMCSLLNTSIFMRLVYAYFLYDITMC